MKNTNRIAVVLMTMSLLVSASAPALAGSCGSTAKHTHPEEAMAPAIFPLAKEAGFSTLVAAIKAAGLDEVLTNDATSSRQILKPATAPCMPSILY